MTTVWIRIAPTFKHILRFLILMGELAFRIESHEESFIRRDKKANGSAQLFETRGWLYFQMGELLIECCWRFWFRRGKKKLNYSVLFCCYKCERINWCLSNIFLTDYPIFYNHIPNACMSYHTVSTKACKNSKLTLQSAWFLCNLIVINNEVDLWLVSCRLFSKVMGGFCRCTLVSFNLCNRL